MISDINKQIIIFNEYKKEFETWEKVTTISPSRRYLGHYHALFVLNRGHHQKDEAKCSEKMQ